MSGVAASLLAGPGPDELEALCKKHSCELVQSYRLPDGQPAWLLECASHKHKVALLDDLAALDAFRPSVRRFAEMIAAGAPSRIDQIVRLHAFVRDRVVHTEEPIETFSPPEWVLSSRIGDCDDTARALLAMLRALGHQGRLATLGQPIPKHVAAQVLIDGAWHWLETTIRAEPGEHPVDAARRLGIHARADLR